MNNLNIRYATIDDYPKIQPIMKQAHDLHVALRPDIYQSNDVVIPISKFEQIIKSKTYIVAEIEKRVVGLLYYTIRCIDSPNHVKRTILYIDTIAVEETLRGKGIGRALLDFVRNIKAENDFDSIELQVNANNLSAIQMYQNYGFKEKSMIMELS